MLAGGDGMIRIFGGAGVGWVGRGIKERPGDSNGEPFG